MSAQGCVEKVRQCGCYAIDRDHEAPFTIFYCPLHAAAGELLRALEAVITLPGFEPDEPYGVAVKTAIAKAKGESA